MSPTIYVVHGAAFIRDFPTANDRTYDKHHGRRRFLGKTRFRPGNPVNAIRAIAVDIVTKGEVTNTRKRVPWTSTETGHLVGEFYYRNESAIKVSRFRKTIAERRNHFGYYIYICVCVCRRITFRFLKNTKIDDLAVVLFTSCCFYVSLGENGERVK